MSGFRDVSVDKSVAVIIPNWNSLELLRRCLGTLRRQECELELMIVDNGSVDGSVEYLRSERVPHVSLPHNTGFAAAVNLGVARTSSSRVLVLNADTALEPGCIATLSKALEGDSSLGGVQPRILQLEAGDADVEAARLYSAGQALTADGRAFEIGAGRTQQSSPRPGEEIFGVCGAACLLRRQMFAELGGYEERYFAFYEDVDLNVRARIAGWKFSYVPEAVVWHVGNASWLAGFSHPGADNARLVARNRLASQFKFMPSRSLPRIVAVEAGSLLRAARQRRLRATWRGKLEAFRWLPALLAERRQLRRGGDPRLARRWLGRRLYA